MKQSFLDNVVIQQFSTTSSHQTYLMEINGHFFEIGRDVAELIEFLKEHSDGEVAIDAYLQTTKGKFEREDIVIFIESLKQKASTTNLYHNKKTAFLYRRELISADALSKFSNIMKTLFRPYVMGAIIILFLVLDSMHFAVTYEERILFPRMDFYLLIGLFLFFVLSSFFHEIGHAAACSHFGIKHGGIGFGLYINIPVFYTDVSGAWKLSRKHRCIVNIGGVYFQMWILLPFLASSLITESPLCDYIILITNLNFLITLNPFFKFDGYWMVTDALGVPNLRKRSKEWLKYEWSKLQGKSVDIRPYLFSLSSKVKVVLIIYTLMVNLFFIIYFFYIIPTFLVRFYQTFPKRFDTLLYELSCRRMPEWNNLQQIILQLLFLVLIVYMIYRSIYPLLKRRHKNL